MGRCTLTKANDRTRAKADQPVNVADEKAGKDYVVKQPLCPLSRSISEPSINAAWLLRALGADKLKHDCVIERANYTLSLRLPVTGLEDDPSKVRTTFIRKVTGNLARAAVAFQHAGFGRVHCKSACTHHYY